MPGTDLLVTGARGFVGRHVVDRARAEGLDVATSACDLRDAEAVDAELARLRPAAVIHLAGSRRGADLDPWTILGDDLAMSANLVRGLAAHAPGSALLVPGSAAQYGMGADEPLREDGPTNALTPYAAVKCTLERALTGPLSTGVRVIWCRAFNHAGPGQGDDAPIAQWAAQIAVAERHGGGTLRVGDLGVVRDILDVRDVADAYLALVATERAEGVINVCSGTGVRLADVCDGLIALTTVPVDVVHDPALMRRVDPRVVVGDPGRLRALTGFAPRVRLAETLAAVLEEQRTRIMTSSGAGT